MTTAATLLLALILAQGHGTKGAGKGGKATAAATPARARGGSEGSGSGAEKGGGDKGSDAGDSGKAKGEASAAADGPPASGGKTLKTKTYNFGAMDVEGKLKTPQLLYFLNRVKLELDMSAPDKRSFMKELEKSADDKNL
jgi:hypothetical protein